MAGQELTHCKKDYQRKEDITRASIDKRIRFCYEKPIWEIVELKEEKPRR